MSDCTRFEDEGLSALLNDVPLDPHFSSCEVCSAKVLAYRKLIDAVGHLDGDELPRDGWQSGVLERIRSAKAEAPMDRSWRRLPIAFGLAASVLAVALLVGQLVRSPTLELSLRLEVVPSDVAYRGESARVGDTLAISTEGLSDAESASIWVYRNSEQLVFACPQRDVCEREAGQLQARFVFAAPGEYRVVVVRGVPELEVGSLDAAVRAAADDAIVSRIVEVE